MAYKWCVVPLCTNTSIKSPQKLFVSVPTNNKRRKMWLQLARRDPNAILSHSNVFMCEDHFDMEKDTINYMKYKMGFSKKILLTDEAVPTKFQCQEDRERHLPYAGSCRKPLLKRQSQGATATQTESSLKDVDEVQKIIEPEELPETQDTSKTDNRQKTIYQNQRKASLPMKVTTTSHDTSPFKIVPCCPKPSQSGVVKTAKKNIVTDSDISCLESSHPSPVTDYNSNSATVKYSHWYMYR